MYNKNKAFPKASKRTVEYTLHEYMDVRRKSYADPEFQRRDDCWDLETRQQFVQSLFGCPIGPVFPIVLVEVAPTLRNFLNKQSQIDAGPATLPPDVLQELNHTIMYYTKQDHALWSNILLDGLQRSTCLKKLLNNSLQIPKGTIFDRDGIYHEFTKSVYWKDVPNSIRNWADQRPCIEVKFLSNLTRSRLEEMFVRIQNGEPLNDIETISARFSPQFGEHVKAIAQTYEKEFISFEELNYRRKGDIAFVSKVAMSVHSHRAISDYCGTKNNNVVSAWSGNNSLALSDGEVQTTREIIGAFFRCAESVDDGIFQMSTKWQKNSLLIILSSMYLMEENIQIKDYEKFTTEVMEKVSSVYAESHSEFGNAFSQWSKKPFSYRQSAKGKTEKPSKAQYFHHWISNAEVKSSRKKAAETLIEATQPIFNQLAHEDTIVCLESPLEVEGL